MQDDSSLWLGCQDGWYCYDGRNAGGSGLGMGRRTIQGVVCTYVCVFWGEGSGRKEVTFYSSK